MYTASSLPGDPPRVVLRCTHSHFSRGRIYGSSANRAVRATDASNCRAPGPASGRAVLEGLPRCQGFSLHCVQVSSGSLVRAASRWLRFRRVCYTNSTLSKRGVGKHALNYCSCGLCSWVQQQQQQQRASCIGRVKLSCRSKSVLLRTEDRTQQQ